MCFALVWHYQQYCDQALGGAIRRMKYPFIPKSTRFLEPGQFWSFPLSDGNSAAGVVLQLLQNGGNQDSRRFLAGLLDWSGKENPTAEILQNCKLIAHGEAHIRAITRNNGVVCGRLNWDDVSQRIPLTLNESPGKNCRIQKGFDVIGKASKKQQESLDVFSTWGYGVIKIRAEKIFVTDA